LVHDLADAMVRFEAAARQFTSIVDDIPSGLPQSDGIRRIQNVSRELAAAGKEKDRAHNRLDDYLNRGIVPEDLKWSG